MKFGVIGPMWNDSMADLVLHGLELLGIENIWLGEIKSNSKFKNYVKVQRNKAFPKLDLISQSKIFDLAIEKKVSHIISVEQELHPIIVKKFKEIGIKVGIWFPDGIGNISSRQYIFACDYDGVFVTDRKLANKMVNIYGLKAHYLPESASLDWHSSSVEFGTVPYCVLIGDYYPTRLMLVKRLYQDGIPIKLFGARIPKWIPTDLVGEIDVKSSVFKNEKANIFRSHSAVININHIFDVSSTNQRLFEATAAGGAVVTEYVDIVEELFEIGKEVFVYQNYRELFENLTKLMGDTKLGKKTGDNAAIRTLTHHTIDKRLSFIINKLNRL